MMTMTRPRERRPRVEREHVEAVRLMQVVRMHEHRHPELARLFHVPNGGGRSKATAGKLKAEGVRRGVPDYLWPMRSAAGDVGLAIELKAQGGRLEPEQREWIAHLSGQGWRCVVAYGWEEAWAAICAYGGIPDRLTLRRVA